MIEFGRRLREARTQAGLSQAEVATRLGIRQSYVSRVERGAQNISVLACVRFAQAMGYLFSTEFMPKPRDGDGDGIAFGRRLREARSGPGSARQMSQRISGSRSPTCLAWNEATRISRCRPARRLRRPWGAYFRRC